METGSRNSKGLNVGILESKEIGNCSNNGVSARCKSVVIVSDDFKINEIFEANESSPAVVIIRRDRNPFNDIIAVPRELLANKRHYMFGGCFIYSSDSRFSSINNGAPIKLFDRVES